MKYLSKILYILIFLVMVTSPYAGHTYAEYAREATDSDLSRISSFGITATATSNAFSVSYLGSGDYADKTVVESAIVDDKVFAPGTSGVLCSYHVTGSAEVHTYVSKVAIVTMNDEWTNDEGIFYCPITFTIGDTTIRGLDYSNMDDLIIDLETEMELGNGEYDANYDFTNNPEAASLNREVTWSWSYRGATGDSINQTEDNDNALGNKDIKPTLSVAFDLTVEQID